MKRKYIIKCYKENLVIFHQLMEINGGKVTETIQSLEYPFIPIYDIFYEADHDLTDSVLKDYNKYYEVQAAINNTPPPF